MNTSATNAARESGANFTTEPATVSLRASVNPTPEFVAMPGPGQVCPYSGLKRGMLYQLTKEKLIRTVSLRRQGTTRARRLIVFSSLMDYLRGLDAEQNRRIE